MPHPTTKSPGSDRKHAGSNVLRFIAVLKFAETMVVIVAGLATLKLLEPSALDVLSDWVRAIPGLATQQFFQRALDHLSGISHRQIQQLGVGAFVFAAIFLAEGIGLWLEKRWAEWLSIVATALFIPLEILELFRHATAPKGVALAVNILIVAYLIARIVLKRQQKTFRALTLT